MGSKLVKAKRSGIDKFRPDRIWNGKESRELFNAELNSFHNKESIGNGDDPFPI